VFGAFLELIRRIYDTAVKRLAASDLFTSEMFNILRVFAAANIIGQFVRLYDAVDTKAPSSEDVAPASSASALAQPAGSENYFEFFQKNSADLSLLDPAAINDITAFYTFLKGARDATGAFRLWNEPRRTTAIEKDDVVSVVYLCFLMTVHGKLALECIIGSKKNRKSVDDIVAGVLLQCFAFLDHVVAQDDFRRPRIEERRASCADLKQKYAYEFGPTESPLASTQPAA
jgi:hypothetical protein